MPLIQLPPPTQHSTSLEELWAKLRQLRKAREALDDAEERILAEIHKHQKPRHPEGQRG